MHGSRFVVCLALVASSSVAAADTSRPRIGVVPGIAVGLDAARVDALGQDLADALSSELLVDAVGGLEIRRKLPPEGIPPDCVATPTCTADVAKRLNASQLLFVVMVDTGNGGVQVDTTWVEPATGRSAARPAIDVTSVAEARARFASSAHALLPEAQSKPSPVVIKQGGIDGKVEPAVPRHVTPPVIVAGAVAVVGLGAGVGFGLRARSKYHTCEDVPTSCTQGRKDGIRTLSALADGGFAIALAGAVTAGILFANSGKESHLIVAPSGPTGGVSLGYSGSF